MSSLAISQQVSSQTQNSNNFCDKKFKLIRVAVDVVSKLCLALFYAIIALPIWIVSRAGGHRFMSQSGQNIESALAKAYAYYKFGDQIIDFSVNSSLDFSAQVAVSARVEALKSQYGAEVIDKWSKMGTEMVPLRSEWLMRLGTSGVCLGMSLDFIKKYLLAIQSGKTPLEAVKSIAPDYVTAAPVNAQLIQIFYKALDRTKLHDKALVRLEQLKTDTLKELDQERVRINALDSTDKFRKKLDELEKLKVEADRKISEMLEEAIISMSLGKCDAMLPFLGLKMVARTTCAGFEMNKSSDLEAFVNKLAAGSYLVVGQKEDHDAHASVLIKTESGLHFIFDPEFAAISTGRPESELVDLTKTWYAKTGGLSFGSIKLQGS